MPLPERYINKTVPFRFAGIDLRFHLSHGLFSSFDIDDGTRLLLKSIAARLDVATAGTVLDVGCGVGVLGVCIGARAPTARVVLRDRDALAVAFAAENATANGLSGVEVECGLGLSGLGHRTFDLILSNLPAKAGPPVLRSFFSAAARRLAPGGTAAFVIVRTLTRLAREAAAAAGLTIAWSEETPRYTLMHLRTQQISGVAPSAPSEEPDELLPYVRTRVSAAYAGVSWEAQTVHSLPDFDSLGRPATLALAVLSRVEAPGEIVFWNPGQGHLPLYQLRREHPSAGITLAARDTLELAISERNLRAAGGAPRGVQAAPWEADLARLLPAAYELLVAVPHPVPGVPWQEDLLAAADGILAPGGRLLVVGTSTEVQRLLASRGRFRPADVKKHAGYRAILLARP